MSARFRMQFERLPQILIETTEKRKLWLLLGFSIIYFVVTCLLAVRKLLWNDELFTFYISRLPSMSDVWGALLSGAEQLPPFFYVVTRISLALFGDNNLTIRLPEILGFWIMSLCLFEFVRKRSSALYGFVAMLFSFVTGAYYYAYEARPYGLVLGFGALALICWQSAAEGRYRKLSLAGLTISFAAAISCHYYAVLLFIPLALGEAARSLSMRRLDWSIWAAFVLAGTPLLFFLPLIEQANSYSTGFWTTFDLMSVPNFFYNLLAPAILPLMITLVLPILLMPLRSNSPNYFANKSPHSYEIIAAVGFVIIPFAAVLLGKLLTGAFTDRYVMPAVIGVSLLLGFATNKLFTKSPVVAAVLVLSLCANFIARGKTTHDGLKAAVLKQTQVNKFLESKSELNIPIVASDQHTFITLSHYGSPKLLSRLVYLADPEASLRYLGHNSLERGMLDLHKVWFGLNVQEYKLFVASQPRFLVYGSAGHFLNWLLSDLRAAEMKIELRGRNWDTLLFEVSSAGQEKLSTSHHPSPATSEAESTSNSSSQ